MSEIHRRRKKLRIVDLRLQMKPIFLSSFFRLLLLLLICNTQALNLFRVLKLHKTISSVVARHSQNKVIVERDRENLANKWLVKQKWQDFVVIEDIIISAAVNPDTTPISIMNTSIQTAEASKDREEMLTSLEIALGASQLESLSSLSSLESRTDGVTVEFSKLLSKSERTSMHTAMKKVFPDLEAKTEMAPKNDTISATTATVATTTRFLVYKKGSKSIYADSNSDMVVSTSNSSTSKLSRKRRKKAIVQRWDSRSRPDYHYFTVYKSGLSTIEVIDELARRTGVLPKRFAYSGMKDKQAVTMVSKLDL